MKFISANLIDCLILQKEGVQTLFDNVNTWWKFSLLSFPKRWWTRMWAVQGWWDLEWKILPKVYNTVYSQAVIWSRFLVQFSSIAEEACIHTRVALTFFCKWGQYSSFASEDNQISKPCQWEGGWYKPALCTCDSENRSQGIKTKRCPIFLIYAVQTPCFGREKCSKELFSTIVFRFFWQSHPH